MIDKSFYGFEAVSFEDWMAKVESDLKGKSLDVLDQEVNDEFKIHPMYKRELDHHVDAPGQFPFLRGAKTSGNAFRLEQSFDVGKATANQDILEALKNGAESIELEGELTADNLEKALNGVHKDFIWIGAKTGASIDELQCLISIAGEQVFLNADPILDGNVSIQDCLSLNQNNDQSYWLSANGTRIANAGGDVVQELTYLIAAGNQYLHTLLENGIDIDTASAKISFSLGLGANYVTQISKVRALRVLWSNLVKLYKPQHSCSMNCWIHGETVAWNKIHQDCNNNMLRATTEAISGVLGGVDSLNVRSINLSQNDAAHNYRIARNISHLIEEESYLSQVSDPLGGSYLIENLTQDLGKAAWKAFKDIEAKGGIQNCLSDVKSDIKATQEQLVEQVKKGEYSLIGANKYAPKDASEWSASELKFIEL